ncbi:type IX secretion system sortase PorU [Aequorivita echinoideorum]|uniref:Type IX secretion system sortase PorU n=1 Tax=Aequorivita echinoideorum TaxID=1549647 RepID=A0ABS5S2R5_9FLAO|nr:type IX secretion system sortase PorU [Aequorivita echinoideorum]MBT0607489.1 type IX secretion system sortase PorU [Aequorivita echinoideorum]
MRKVILVLIILVLPLLAISQSRNVTIDWGDSSQNSFGGVSEKSAKSIREKALNTLSLQISNETLIYQTQWEDSGFADRNSITVSNITYGALTSEELKKVNVNLVPNQFTYSIASTESRDVVYTILTASPVVRTNGSLRKVISFSVDYRYGPQARNPVPPISNSVLASGKWYKFKVENTGIHRLDKSFLNSLGLNTDNINPRNIKVYGNGGKPLRLLNRRNDIFDLPENSIQVVGEEDGSFDNGDFVIFYATSTKGYDLENDSNLNPYSDDSYYYVTADGGAGKRVQNMVEPSGAATISINQFNDYQFHEEDEESPTKLGRRWYGNRFDVQNEQTYEFVFPNIVTAQPLNIVIKSAAASESATSLAVSVNSTSLNPINFSALGENQLLIAQNVSTEVLPSGETVTMDFNYNNGGNPSSVAYLDYIAVSAVRQLTGAGAQLQFTYNEAGNLSGIGEYQISNAAQFTQVWDVTDYRFITAKQNSENSSALTFKANLGQQRKYVAINPNDYYTPIKLAQSVVPNQNLKGTIFNDASGNFKDVDYLIITAPFLIQPALRLANYHKDLQGLNVKVVTTDKIYEEFSSGKQDIGAIRNFIRYVYDNASAEANRVKYVCLFGDTSIDYKNRLPNNNNIVPSFHTLEGRSSTDSFVSDDYFGGMAPEAGTIGGGSIDFDGSTEGDSDKLDIAMGRMIVDNVQQANAMVDKVINYTSKDSYGNWRTNFVLVSDDVDVSSEQSLQEDLDALGDEISANKPFVNVKKIHSDSYQQETSAGGNRYPDVNDAITKSMEVGAIILNYFGHGGEDGLAHEVIYTKEMAQEYRNINNLPCVVTITCEFTKFDNPLRITAGELTYQNPDGGAISLITTTRSIFIDLGQTLNLLMADELFGFTMDIPNPPAEALRIAKNDLTDFRRRVVFYIGDPAMSLAFPKKEIRLTTLNGVPIGQAADTLKALSRVKFEGEVTNTSGAVLNNYNGILEAKVFDKYVQRQTLNNDGQGEIFNFTTLGEGIFNGQATVTNGRFEFEFVVPRDIQIPVGKGRVSLYAQRDNQLEDQAGFNQEINVGGLNENAPADNEGPRIRLFMNDESFVSGGITDDSPNLIAKLEDTNGINTASGIGHDIVAILDGDESNPFLLNEFYQAEVDDYTRGATSYKFRDLEDGLHTLTLKAWDVYNNSSTAEIQFIVAGDDELKITRVLNYPNPFVNYTEFWFNHNRPDETLDVQVQVFTVTGKVVWTKNQTLPPSGSFLSRDIVWDGRDDFGDRIGKGVYVYKITVKSSLTNQRVEKFEKLVIL